MMNEISQEAAATPLNWPKIRSTWLPYGRQSLDSDDEAAVLAVLRSDWLTQGPVAGRFEEAFAEYVGAKFAVAFSNGTEALVAAHRAAGVGPGDWTLTTPITFAASANAAFLVGAKPEFCDVDPATGLMDPAALASRMISEIKAIVPVHYAGACCDMDEILKIARAYDAVVIEDACHAPGATYRQGKAGSLADMAAFSFHPVKPIACGEGGMVTTNNPEWAQRLRAIATHGIYRDTAYEAVGPWHYEMRDLGTNARLSELHAALGLSQLSKSNDFLARRRELAKRYRRLLSGQRCFNPVEVPEFTQSAVHLFPVLVDFSRLSCDKKTLVESLHKMNIGVQVHYIPVHHHPYYRERGYTDEGLSKAVEFSRRELSLPLFASMTDADQDDVITALSVILDAFGV